MGVFFSVYILAVLICRGQYNKQIIMCIINVFFTVSVLTVIRVISVIGSLKYPLILYAPGTSLRGLFP